jgi:hypothetical protein
MYVLAKGKDLSQKITVSEAAKRWQLSSRDVDKLRMGGTVKIRMGSNGKQTIKTITLKGIR